MINNKLIMRLILVLIGVSFFACNDDPKQVSPKVEKPVIEVKVPIFDADSAFSYVAKQVEFGPRVPGTKAHAECASWMVEKFKSFGADVTVQDFKARAFDGKILDGKNIVASYNPEATKRVILAAHWDSRPFADNDPNTANHFKPIDGANDGASGVGVLMEVARLLKDNKINIGIDIILFDLEDYGQHQHSDAPQVEDSWGLGSQFWSKNPHKPSYTANYGILLDMVGNENLNFTKEYFSMNYAPAIVNKVWNAAKKIGYSNVFVDKEMGSVMDDHVYVNRYAKIPMIDIIHHEENSNSSFYPHWHTVEDKLDKIKPESLKITGQTVLQVIYSE